ncbi:hypothetical protein G6045_21730 [Streptomyces sp. YC504]|uniref:Uncharacterized protein n=1 Tax=Streptomyces mesophilus TaxID=1775132 RepID=A0A6G4XM11_9ACTN|nr:hypothetical protein [Streptomyces mesophilus]NGO78263.1 hypothetical protein [Streptomyces mesophilus]
MAVRKLLLRIAGGAVALAVLVPGYLWLHGDFRRWDNEAKLDAACGGLLDRSVMREVLGEGDVTVRGWDDTPHHVRCEVVIGGGGKADVRVADETAISVAGFEPFLGGREHALAVPVGNGWSGLFGADSGDEDETEGVTTALTLHCTAGEAKTLMVTVTAEFTDARPLDDPANRPVYARIAEATARKVSDVRGCEAELGERLRSLPLPVREDEYKPLADADGTCAGIEPVRGVRTALEVARNGAPYERCRLNGADGESRYGLEASFGSYAQAFFRGNRDSYRENLPTGEDPAHHRTRGEGVSWTTAKCPGGTALFTLFASGDEDDKTSALLSGDLAHERAALKTFAERSAKAHGCQAPKAP